MSEIKLYSLKPEVEEKVATSVLLEKELQRTIEKNMELFFGVRLLKTEYPIKDGRMDSIGIDENNSPVIFEYKRLANENIINQGLFYVDWLMEHKADYKLLVKDVLGEVESENIDWSAPSVFCIANSFNKYDLHAVNQMQRNIKLIKYRKYGDDLLLLEQLNAPSAFKKKSLEDDCENNERTQTDVLSFAPNNIIELYEDICGYIENLGDDIESNLLKKYKAYRKIKNFCCIEVQKKQILLHLKLNPDSVVLEDGFTRDMRLIGHFGTGDLDVSIRTSDDIEKAKPLIERAYMEG